MRNQAILISSLLIAAGSAWAGESLLENAAKQTAVESVKSAAPGAVQKVESAEQTLENAKTLKATAENAPGAVKDQAKEAVAESVKQKIDAAIPAEAKESVAKVKAGKESIGKLKNKAQDAPKAIKEGAKQKATEKALDLLR